MLTDERRSFPIAELRIVAAVDGKPAMITGHAAVFGQLSDNLGGFREKISAGAFAESLKKDDIRALFNHDPSFVLGRNKSGTLRLMEDETGLRVEIDPPDTQAARDLSVSIARGDISQMSFGFRVPKGGDSWGDTADGVVRTVMKASVFDVSPVTYPAYPQTDCAMRSLGEWRSERDKGSEEFRQSLVRYQKAIALQIGPSDQE